MERFLNFANDPLLLIENPLLVDF